MTDRPTGPGPRGGLAPDPLGGPEGAPWAAGAPRGTPRVLVADDSAPIRRAIYAALDGLPLSLASAVDVPAALTAVDAGAPDLILADLNLPEGGARTLVEHLARRRQELPVVVLMSPLDDFDPARGRRMGAAGVFIKPFEAMALRELVARFCPQAWQSAVPEPPAPDPGAVAKERIRREVLSAARALGEGGVEPALEREVAQLFDGERLDPRVEAVLKEVIREELVRILPAIAREVIRARIAEIEAEVGPRRA